MCGIVAIFAYHPGAPAVSRHELLAVRDAMVPRGPDDAGQWHSPRGEISLGHRRLSIIDLSPGGHQPMASADGRFRIVYNGEVYNYRALKDALRQQGHTFRSESDTEVLLVLYERHGPEMVRYLRGMYAFALWDEQRRTLFLARDPFGIKPLYYAYDGRTIRVASQVKALLAGADTGDTLDPAGAVGFFLWGSVPEPHTLYRDIRALPAGAHLWVDCGGVHGPTSFFSARDELAAAEESPEAVSGDELAARLREALLDSVEHHLVADVPVGVFLSAGLDSTTLAALAAERHGSGIRTLTLGFEEYRGSHDDEVPLAETVARALGTDHETRWVRGADFGGELERLLTAMDQPTIDGVNVYFVSKVAAEAGLKVALSGLGGDELFAGYPSYRQVPALARSFRVLRSLPALGKGFRWLSAPVLKHFTSPKYASLLEYGTSVADAYLLRRGLFMPWELPQILDPELVRQGWADLQTRLRLSETVARLGGDFAQMAALEMTWFMRNQLLRDADWAGMAHSLEIRVPLVDVELFRRIVPLRTAGVPPSKRQMASTPRQPHPAGILQRQKTGFTVPVRDWLQEYRSAEMRAATRTGRGPRDWARFIFAANQRAASSVLPLAGRRSLHRNALDGLRI